jgi:hypothetical protein
MEEKVVAVYLRHYSGIWQKKLEKMKNISWDTWSQFRGFNLLPPEWEAIFLFTWLRRTFI